MSEHTDTARRALRLQSLQLETTTPEPTSRGGWQLDDDDDGEQVSA